MDPQELKSMLDQANADIEKAIAQHKTETEKTLAELKSAWEQQKAEFAQRGHTDPETAEKIDRIEKKYQALEAQMAHAATVNDPPVPNKTVGQRLVELPEFKSYIGNNGHLTRQPAHFNVGTTFEKKSATTRDTLGFATTGVINFDRVAGFFGIGRQPLRIRDVMRVRTTTAGAVDFIKFATRTNNASPQTEGVSKVESTFTLQAASATVRTIAHYMQVTRQSMADVPGFAEEIDVELMYGLKVKEESEVLAGDGLGIHLTGLMTGGTAYDTTLNVENDTQLDKLRHAIYQVRSAYWPADTVVVNPKDAHNIELLKTTDKQYLVGDVRNGNEVGRIWGKQVVESDSIASGYFLVGAFQIGAFLVDRELATVDISFESGTNFVENEATIRCEERIALALVRPTAFVYGAF